MSIRRGNAAMIMSEAQISANIPEHFKDRYWIKEVDENQNVSYTVRTWKQLTEDAEYKLGHGGTPYFEDAIYDLHGNYAVLDTAYVVSIASSAMLGDVGAILPICTYFLNFQEANDFINFNTTQN